MFTFFTIVFGLIWAVASFILLFKVWDSIGPAVLSISKSHVVQISHKACLLALLIVFALASMGL